MIRNNEIDNGSEIFLYHITLNEDISPMNTRKIFYGDNFYEGICSWECNLNGIFKKTSERISFLTGLGVISWRIN
jgi:hypothetical protein